MLFRSVANLTEGSTYTRDEVSVDYNLTDTAGYVLTFYNVWFSSRMPVILKLIIPNMEIEMEDGKTTFSGNGIVPWAVMSEGANPMEFAQYIISDFTGTIQDETFSVSFVCGKTPTTFTGSKK